MTGNTNKWRKPLAGLAAVATLATMGLVAGTANASTWVKTGTADATVTVNGNGYDKGYSYADVIAAGVFTGKAFSDSLLALEEGTPNFSGFKVNGQSVALTGVAKDGDKVEIARNYNKENGLLVHYTATTDKGKTDLGYVWVSATPASLAENDLNATITAGQLPYDAADGVALDVSGLVGVHHFANTALGSTVEVNVPAQSAYKLTFNNIAKTGSTGLVSPASIVYPGSVADDKTAGALTVDVPQNGTFDPQPVIDSAVVVNSTAAAIRRFVQQAGSEVFSKDTKVDDSFTYVTPEVVAGHEVTYKDGGTTLKTEVVYDGGTPAAYTPTREDGSIFAGWLLDANNDGKADSAQTVEPTKLPVRNKVTYLASWVNGGSHTVTYKFNDGTTADQKVTVKASQKLARPDSPKRDGWIFAGWYVDANNDGILNAGETEFTEFGKTLSQNYTLIAKWIKADKATLEAAFNYVDGGDESFNDSKYGVHDQDHEQSGVFTKASFAEYVKTYQAVQADYAQAKNEADAKNEQIPADTYNSLLNRLVAAWQKLEFVHEGNQLSNTTVNRLYNSKSGDHFYTQSQEELATLTAKDAFDYGYSNEGRLFQTTPKGNAKYSKFNDAVYAHLESFAYANNSDVEKTLESLTDPILTKVTRLYNRVNGDHVWSVSADEVASLSASADWNNEGAAFYVPRYTGSQSVTRLYNAKLSRHVLSTSAAEQANLARNGWTVEGVAFKAY